MLFHLPRTAALVHGLPRTEWRVSHFAPVLPWFASWTRELSEADFACRWTLEGTNGKPRDLVTSLDRSPKLEKHQEEKVLMCACTAKQALTWHPLSSLVFAADPAAATVQIISPDSEVADRIPLWEELIRRISNLFEPFYGHGTSVRIWNLGEWLGLKEPRILGPETMTWNQMARRLAQQKNYRELRSKLKDIFEWQLLTEEHLALPVAGSTLRAWIVEGQRGVLEAVSTDVMSWKVPKAKIPALVRDLTGSGILYDRRR